MNGSAECGVKLRVIKLGGSLLDDPQLGERFQAWLSAQPAANNVVVVGGGAIVDSIRALDRVHSLDAVVAHHLCIRAMSLTAQMAAHVLGEAEPCGWPLGDTERRLRIVDVASFIEEDQRKSNDPLPCDWQVTSDSIAARMAAVLRAGELVLLKSALPEGTTFEAMADAGYVDRFFSRAAVTRPVRFINLRAERPAERTFES